MGDLLTITWTTTDQTPFASWGTLTSGGQTQGWRETVVSHTTTHRIDLTPIVGVLVCVTVLIVIKSLSQRIIGGRMK